MIGAGSIRWYSGGANPPSPPRSTRVLRSTEPYFLFSLRDFPCAKHAHLHSTQYHITSQTAQHSTALHSTAQQAQHVTSRHVTSPRHLIPQHQHQHQFNALPLFYTLPCGHKPIISHCLTKKTRFFCAHPSLFLWHRPTGRISECRGGHPQLPPGSTWVPCYRGGHVDWQRGDARHRSKWW
jgi:hypothetical protein